MPLRGVLRRGMRAGLGRQVGIGVSAALVVLGFAWLLARGALPVVPRAELLQRMSLMVWVGYAAIWLGVMVLRSVRWSFLLAPLAPVPVAHVVCVSFAGLGAMALFPFRLGELARPALLKDEHITPTQALGTVGAERVIDGLFVSALLAVGLAVTPHIAPLPTHVGGLPLPAGAIAAASVLALMGFGGVFIALLFVLILREQLLRMVAQALRVLRVPAGAAVWCERVLMHLLDGLRFLPDGKNLARFVSMTALYWLVNALGFWWVLAMAGLDVGLGASVVMMCCIGLGLLVPTGPGYFGAYQIAAYASLAMYVPADAVLREGALATFVLYAVQVGLVLLLGGIAYVKLAFYSRKK